MLKGTWQENTFIINKIFDALDLDTAGGIRAEVHLAKKICTQV